MNKSVIENHERIAIGRVLSDIFKPELGNP